MALIGQYDFFPVLLRLIGLGEQLLSMGKIVGKLVHETERHLERLGTLNRDNTSAARGLSAAPLAGY